MSAGARVMLDGRLVAPERARISPLGDGFQFGWGLFETMRVQTGRVVFFDDHAERLARSSAALGLGLEAPPGAAERCRRTIAAGGRRVGALKWILYRNEAGRTGEAILPRDNPYSEEHYRRGFVLRTAAGGGAGAKTLARLGHALARREARAAGADEALFVGPDGEVREGAATNIFAVEGGVLLTPPLDGRILPGVARARVVRLGSAREAGLSRERLLAADEVFVTNALLGVMPVARVDARRFPVADNPVTRELRRLYEAEAAAVSRR